MVVILFLIMRRRRKRPAEQNETMSPEKELGVDNAHDGKVFTLSDKITSYNLEQNAPQRHKLQQTVNGNYIVITSLLLSKQVFLTFVLHTSYL
eukprot:gene16122-17749_t